jgi:hypothetical protein
VVTPPEIPCTICGKPVDLSIELCADEQGHSTVYALRTTDMGRFSRKPLIRALFICKPPL